FRRRKSKVDPLASSGSKGTASAADGSSPADGNRPAASLHVPARRGLFRRRRSNGHHLNGDGAGGQPRPLSRASSGGGGGGGVGLSLSDTDSRPRATIAVCGGGGISSSAHSGVRARGSPEGSGLLSKSDLSRTGGSGGWVGALASGGGGRESPPSSVYPAPQPLHRIRSSGDDGMGLSQDPNFFPPIPLAEDGCSEKPSSRGEVRFGDFIRLWCHSNYADKAGYVGYLRRTSRKRNSVGKGELFVLPPVPASPYSDGRLHGRLGPSLFGNGGHMRLKLCKTPKPPPESGRVVRSSSTPASPVQDGGTGREGEDAAAIWYGDSCEMVAKKVRPHREGVVRAPVTHFRRRHQIQLGGYLRSDGKGYACAFTIHHAPPRVSMVSVYSFSSDGTVADTHTHYKIPWNQVKKTGNSVGCCCLVDCCWLFSCGSSLMESRALDVG
ncbi:unnamed protein product, partial [Ectocarpus sp. 12 AP-2014]